MALQFHPELGTIVICDYDKGGFIPPEMIKRRLAIVISPRLRHRDRLCTVVPLSTTPPSQVMPYHYNIKLDESFRTPHDYQGHWVKADMISTVSFDRLSLPYRGKNISGKRDYFVKIIKGDDLKSIRGCVLYALALFSLTEHL